MLRTHVTRRRLIATGTAVALGATGLALGSEPAGAQASVEFGTLDIPDADIGAEDGEVYAPHLLIDGQWEYRGLDTQPAKWAVYLLVAPEGSDSWSAIGITDGETTALENSGAFTIRGAVTASGAFGPEDFAVASDGTASTTTVRVGLLFMVDDASGNTLADAEVTQSVPITVSQTGASAALGGSGIVAGQDDVGDPTPTVPGGG